MPRSNDPVRHNKIYSKLKLNVSWVTKFQSNIKALAFILLSVAIFTYGINIKIPEPIESAYYKGIAYVHNFSNYISNSLRDKKNSAFDYINLKKSYNELQKENLILRSQKYEYLKVMQENEDLKKVVKFSSSFLRVLKTTEITMLSSDGYADFAEINVGKQDGVRVNNTVTSVGGFVVGRVVDVYDKKSKVLLITSPSSRMSVFFTKSSIKGIVGGNYKGDLSVSMLHGEDVPEQGEVVITSGDGGFFPPNLVVGEVSESIENSVKVTTAINTSKAHIVIVLDN